MAIRLDADKRRLYFSQRGTLDKESVLQSYQLMLGFEGFDTRYDRVVDYRELSDVNLAVADLKEIIGRGLELSREEIRVAIVIGESIKWMFAVGLFCELSNTFGSLKVIYKPFRTLAKAEQWLDSNAR